MALLIEPITQSLAPGVALTSVIFYNTSLQNRFIYITGRIRELNREARALGVELEQAPSAAEPASRERHVQRLSSVRWQVNLMNRRALLVRRTILTAYVGFGSFIATMLMLLLQGTGFLGSGGRLPMVFFTTGLLSLSVATLLSTSEMYLSHRTVVEDIRSSFPAEGA